MYHNFVMIDFYAGVKMKRLFNVHNYFSGKGLLKSRATLVVCPASLVHQWNKEIERRCRRALLKVIVYHGPNRETDINRYVFNESFPSYLTDQIVINLKRNS